MCDLAAHRLETLHVSSLKRRRSKAGAESQHKSGWRGALAGATACEES